MFRQELWHMIWRIAKSALFSVIAPGAASVTVGTRTAAGRDSLSAVADAATEPTVPCPALDQGSRCLDAFLRASRLRPQDPITVEKPRYGAEKVHIGRGEIAPRSIGQATEAGGTCRLLASPSRRQPLAGRSQQSPIPRTVNCRARRLGSRYGTNCAIQDRRSALAIPARGFRTRPGGNAAASIAQGTIFGFVARRNMRTEGSSHSDRGRLPRIGDPVEAYRLLTCAGPDLMATAD